MKVELAWVDALLCRWGRWALRCDGGALGFASCSIMACSGDGGGFDTTPPRGVMDDDMEAVDGAVSQLPWILRVTVMQVYQFGQGKSDRKVAAILGVDRMTMGKYVCEAHRKIALDISIRYRQNHAQSANGGSCPDSNQPVTARA